MILYEHPFNERIRTWLRLEHLFERCQALVQRTHAIDHHFALVTIFEIMEVSGRCDLKSEVMRELERQKMLLNGFRGNPSVQEGVLRETVARLDACFSALQQGSGKPGQTLAENDWLMGIRSRVGIPGGTCEFDLPAYYHWQHYDSARRQSDLQRWLSSFIPLSNGITLLLTLLREGGWPQKMSATSGLFQQTLPPGRSFQLLRLGIDEKAGFVPEISANRLVVAVRMMASGEDGKQSACTCNVDFEMSLCA